MTIRFKHVRVSEATIITKVVECLLEAGYSIAVDNGDDEYEADRHPTNGSVLVYQDHGRCDARFDGVWRAVKP